MRPARNRFRASFRQRVTILTLRVWRSAPSGRGVLQKLAQLFPPSFHDQGVRAEEDLVGRAPAETVPRPIVELCHDLLQLGLGDRVEAAGLREVLPDQAIGVLVATALPGGVGLGEVEADAQVPGDPLVVGNSVPLSEVRVRTCGASGCSRSIIRSATARALRRASGASRISRERRSVKDTRTPLLLQPTIVSASQSPRRDRCATTAGRCSMGTRFGIVEPRGALP